jgi:hypothetical protein
VEVLPIVVKEPQCDLVGVGQIAA